VDYTVRITKRGWWWSAFC